MSLSRVGNIPTIHVAPDGPRVTAATFTGTRIFDATSLDAEFAHGSVGLNGLLMRQRAELLGHVQLTNQQYNLPEIGKKIA